MNMYVLNDFLYYLSRIHSRPASFVTKKLVDEAKLLGRTILAKVGHNVYKHPDAGHSRLGLGHLFGSSEECSVAMVKIREDEAAAIIRKGYHLRHSNLSILGSGLMNLGDTIDWQRDYKSGSSWTFKFHALYSYSELLDLERASDIKIPWELSRLQFIPFLLFVYRMTGDDQYVRKAVDLLWQWEDANPVGYGVGWVSTMDVALRAVSLLLAAELAAGTPLEESFVTERFVRVLAEHGRFIYRNLEYSDINGNHHTSCLLGLLYLGLYVHTDPEAERWKNLALCALPKEILAQTYEDGVCHEGSIPYHRLVTELFLHAAVISSRWRIDLGKDYYTRLEQMCDFILAYTKPSGEAPVLGDADDGRVHNLGGQKTNDHRYLLCVAAALFKRADMKAASGGLWADAVCLLGSQGVKLFLELPQQKTNASPKAYSAGGVFFLRNGLDYVVVDCGDVGLRGRGGHGHNDALSIEVCLMGRDIITDPGCYTYSGSISDHRLDISAVSHNVFVVDELEPAPFGKARLVCASRLPSKLIHWEDGPEHTLFVGEHYGYRRLMSPVTCRRLLKLNKRQHEMLISDTFIGTGKHKIEWRFHLAVEWEFVTLNDKSVVSITDGNNSFMFRSIGGNPNVHLGRSFYSRSYGIRQTRWCIIATAEIALPTTVTFMVSSAYDQA